MFTKIKRIVTKKGLIASAAVVSLFTSVSVFASTSPIQGSGIDLGTAAQNVATNLGNSDPMIWSFAYILGVVFTLLFALSIKQAKDMHQQQGWGKPIVYATMAAGLFFTPSVLQMLNQTELNGQGSSAGPTGNGTFGNVTTVS